MKQLKKVIHKQLYAFLAFLQATVAALGSLYFSEIWRLVPCQLCWLQRIFMYPLVAILAVGLWRGDKKLYQYVFPFSIPGLAIAIYHTIIYYQANYNFGTNETILTACSGGVSCTNLQIEWFGFVSIPLLSVAAFAIINLLMLLDRRHTSQSSRLHQLVQKTLP